MNCKKRINDRITAATGQTLDDWRPHDFRRTFSTLAGGGVDERRLENLTGRDRELATGLGIAPHTVEAILNHVSGHKSGVAGTYNRSTYAAEKRIALDRWAEHLLAIVEERDNNITPIRKRA
jgi:integrase